MADCDRWRLLGPFAHTEFGALGDLAVGLLDQRPDLLGGDVAGDHHHRIVGRVEAPVERERILAVELLDLRAPADHRASVGMIEIERRSDLLAEPRLRAVGDAHVVFFQHHVALGQHVLVVEHEAGHAVGLGLHDGRQVFAGDALEISGVVGGGEGVLLAADGGEDLREAPLRILLGALEHQVLEEMGEPGLAGLLVRRPDLVPDHVGHDRRAVVGNDDDLEPVVESEMGDVGAGDGGPAADEQQRRRDDGGINAGGTNGSRRADPAGGFESLAEERRKRRRTAGSPPGWICRCRAPPAQQTVVHHLSTPTVWWSKTGLSRFWVSL